jgi:hypothetical protein
MPLLHMAFQEGFDDDLVVVRVDGNEIFYKDHVKTRTQIGYADSFENNFNEGPVAIDIELPNRSLSKSERLQLHGATYVGVSVEQEHIRCRISDQPFGYL